VVVHTQAQVHGFDPKDAVIEVKPREGELLLRTEDIEATIAEHGDSIALVLFAGLQYYTGQWFDVRPVASRWVGWVQSSVWLCVQIPRITAAGHAVGAYVGFDLAHAVGNVPLQVQRCSFVSPTPLIPRVCSCSSMTGTSTSQRGALTST
jgi:kynureninase